MLGHAVKRGAWPRVEVWRQERPAQIGRRPVPGAMDGTPPRVGCSARLAIILSNGARSRLVIVFIPPLKHEETFSGGPINSEVSRCSECLYGLVT
jgi:hypothetical protein